ncbi:uncharacterized protein LY79DRAFT_563627 [Colletotrichum navitas]|uniref:Uncharacterized protein n=1 Tax=Colletotrichum navitas TaxID=681940 RepID=A0AAD8UZY6_9PEZI|nr:uncharacterized protein LY79DRAFT_563627 [Colletotrichum navitas]KAK1579695.1 hypothetical protein LY79DRAFT_563627 [Colletotrichum navitas]
MRITFITVVALLTGAVTAAGTKPGTQANSCAAVTPSTPLQNGQCHGHTLRQMSRQDINDCAAHYDPTVKYPVWDESEDFSCSMCPPKKTLLKLKKKQMMSKNRQKSLQRNGPIQERGIISCIDCLVSSAIACTCGGIAAVVCCPCLTYGLIEMCIRDCT